MPAVNVSTSRLGSLPRAPPPHRNFEFGDPSLQRADLLAAAPPRAQEMDATSHQHRRIRRTPAMNPAEVALLAASPSRARFFYQYPLAAAMVCQQVAYTSPRSSALPKRRTPRSLSLSLEVAALRNELAELRALVQPAVAAAAAPPSYVSPEAKEAEEAFNPFPPAEKMDFGEMACSLVGRAWNSSKCANFRACTRRFLDVIPEYGAQTESQAMLKPWAGRHASRELSVRSAHFGARAARSPTCALATPYRPPIAREAVICALGVLPTSC